MMNLRTLTFLLLSLLILSSCGGEPEQDAKSHLKAIRFDVMEPADAAVSKQNDAINEFMTRLKNREEIDWVSEMGEIINLHSKAAKEVDNSLKKIESVPSFKAKNDLRQETINYLEKIAEFEKEIEPSLNGLKDGMDLVSMMKLSSQLKNGAELDAASKAYQNTQKAFMKEHGINGLDVMKMKAEN